MDARPKIVVLGSMCRLPVPGVVFQLLHYLVGLERLGFDAYYVEWHGNWVADPLRPDVSRVPVADVLADYGFGERWTCGDPEHGPGAAFGPVAASRLPGLFREAHAILNVTGAHHLTTEMKHCPVRIYVETDPGIPQIRLAEGDEDTEALLAAHTHHLTFGELIGRPECSLPHTDFNYVPTRQPIVLDLWNLGIEAGRSATTIARWRKAKDKSIQFQGTRYHWDKSREFAQFIDLPSTTRTPLRLALSEATVADVESLIEHGWHVDDAMKSCVQLDDYQRYIADSSAEFTIAKDQYVRLETGWFSDRSACYLAAGRPVVTQETGFSEIIPTGAGLFSFSNEDEARSALEQIDINPSAHRAAALELAHTYFDSDTVLTELLEGCGVEVPGTNTGRRPAWGADADLRAALETVGTDVGSVVATPLGTDRVLRLSIPTGPRASLIAKLTPARRARVENRVLAELLPSQGLGDLAAALLAEWPARADTVAGDTVWHLYADLGTRTLASPACPDPSAGPEDLGFLHPVRAAIADVDLDRVMEAAGRLHARFADVDTLLGLPPLDDWFVRSAFGGAAAELRRLVAADGSWHTTSEPLFPHLETSVRLFERSRTLLASTGPTTLLHGDLGPNNIMIGNDEVRFIDWDHAGRGPAVYDLSTLLSQLEPHQRRPAIDHYRRHNPGGLAVDWSALDTVFELFERARIATTITSAVHDLSHSAEWTRHRLEEIRVWFDGVGPLLGETTPTP